jgi:uncharacterized membrane protein YphA (DoxX/SURF4 family)
MRSLIRLFGNVMLLVCLIFAGIWVWHYWIEYQEFDLFTVGTPLIIVLVGAVLRYIFAGPIVN